jgi:hypothetical protein
MHVPKDMINNPLPASSLPPPPSVPSKGGKKGKTKSKKGKGAVVRKPVAVGAGADGAAANAIWQTMMHVVGAVHFVDEPGQAPAFSVRPLPRTSPTEAYSLFPAHYEEPFSRKPTPAARNAGDVREVERRDDGGQGAVPVQRAARRAAVRQRGGPRRTARVGAPRAAGRARRGAHAAGGPPGA